MCQQRIFCWLSDVIVSSANQKNKKATVQILGTIYNVCKDLEFIALNHQYIIYYFSYLQ